MLLIMAVHHAGGVKRLLLFSALLFTVLQDVSGFDCDLTSGSSGSVLDKMNFISAKSCPGIMDSDDKMFCCQTEKTLGIVLNYCCDVKAFVQMQWVIYTMVGIAAGILLGCCLCGCCCYRRRTRGAVYGRVQTVVMQQPAPVQAPPPVMPYPHITISPYPAHSTSNASSQQYHLQDVHQPPPPPYSVVTTEAYAKQAPYNPHQY